MSHTIKYYKIKDKKCECKWIEKQAPKPSSPMPNEIVNQRLGYVHPTYLFFDSCKIVAQSISTYCIDFAQWYTHQCNKIIVPSVKGQRRLLLHIKIKFHYFTRGLLWIMLFTWILTFSLNHSMFIVSCKVLSCISMSMPRTIVLITHAKHNMKISWMEHHIQTPKRSFTWTKIRI